MIASLKSRFTPNTLQRYLLQNFLGVLTLCLLAATSLFLVFDIFERMRVFVREDASFLQAFSYIGLKIPLIVHLMTPVAVLVATLISIGRLSQSSEITAMRACGMSVFAIVKPLVAVGALISLAMLLLGETLVPWATERVEEIYNIDIKKKHLEDGYDKANFWYRDDNKFYDVGLYDSRTKTLKSISIFEFDKNFKMKRRTDAERAVWSKNPLVGWIMEEVVEIGVDQNDSFSISTFPQLPLVIEEGPEDFRNIQRRPETMSYFDLKQYIEKLRGEGVQVTRYLVDLAAKISFPMVNMILVLVAFPFALISARSGTLTSSFIAGVAIGFGYYVVHAISTSLGAAELLPILPAAWAANVLIGFIGLYLMAGAEFNS